MSHRASPKCNSDGLRAEQIRSLLAAKGALAQRYADAALRIMRINDRVQTLGYGIEAGAENQEDEAEQAALLLSS